MIQQSPGLGIMLLGFVLLLGPLVFVHELGHYLVARWCGVRADVFSIGFGPEIAGWTDRRGTRWKLSALPLGGYVQFAGDMNPASRPDAGWLALPAWEREAHFHAKPLWQRALIVAAGPATNFLLAIAILAGFAMAYGAVYAPPVIGVIEPGSAAAAAGLRGGDRVVAMLGGGVSEWSDLKLAIATHPGEDLALVIERGGRRMAIAAAPRVHTLHDRFGNAEKIGYLGIHAARAELRRVGPVAAVALACRDTVGIVRLTLTGIGQIITGRRGTEDLGGPIRIAKVSGEQLSLGWSHFASLVAMISINLGFINLLPIPVLDGGHLALYGIEAVRRKPVSERGQEWAFRTGLALVLALMLFVTLNDLASLKLFGG